MNKTPEELQSEIESEILWAESLLDCLLDGELEDAIKAVEAWLLLMRRNRRKLL